MTDIYEILRGQKDADGNYEKKPVIVQGITGKYGSAHAKLMLEYGTNIVAGVTPGKGGQKFEDKIPIYESVKEAVRCNRCRNINSLCSSKIFPWSSKRSSRIRNKITSSNS